MCFVLEQLGALLPNGEDAVLFRSIIPLLDHPLSLGSSFGELGLGASPRAGIDSAVRGSSFLCTLEPATVTRHTLKAGDRLTESRTHFFGRSAWPMS